MLFVNQYTRTAPHQYNFATEFVERRSFVYAVGQLEDKRGLITKLNHKGKVKWENSYSISRKTLDFKKIINANGGKGRRRHQYIVYATSKDNSKHYILSIDRNGNIIWSNEVFLKTVGEVFLLENKTEKSFYLVASNRKEKPSVDSFITLIKFNANGKVLITKKIEDEGVGVQLIHAKSYTEGVLLIVARGTNLNRNNQVIDLNSNLEYVHAFYLERLNTIRLEDVLVTYDERRTKQYFVSGYDYRQRKSFITLVKLRGSFILKYINDTANFKIKAYYGNNYYYLKTENGYVCKIDTALNLVWLKLFNLDGSSRELKEVTYNTATNQVTFIAHSTEYKNVVSYINSELDSCKTIVINKPEIRIRRVVARRRRITLVNTKINVKEQRVAIKKHSPIEIKLCFEQEGQAIKLDGESIQSPYVYVQAAGSTGFDGSTQGIHLRWMFKHILGDNHLAKGNYANNNKGFNRNTNDFVKIYRAPYVKTQIAIDFSNIPDLVVDNQRLWVYEINENVFYIRFKSISKYIAVRNAINPLENPGQFIINYGNELIEIENRTQLSFTVELESQNISGASTIQTELIAVEKNSTTSPKGLISRRTINAAELATSEPIKLVAENIRGIRFKSFNCSVLKLNFELYTDFLEDSNENRRWIPLGEYALTLEDNIALKALEPIANTVHGKWERFNNNAYTNIENYTDKWNGPTSTYSRNVKQVVEKYITLSDNETNPRAIEDIPFSDTLPEGVTLQENDTKSISNLDLLRLAAFDYHEARMMGLGHLDFGNEVQEGKYVYLMEYITRADLEDGLGKGKVQHIYMTLPTEKADQRLPIPIDLKEPVFGLVSNLEGTPTVALTDENGYTDSGTARFISLFNEELKDYPYTDFYETTEEFNLSETTTPVFAGIEYKKEALGEINPWRKPELSNTKKYQNIVPIGEVLHNETVPVLIPEHPNEAMYVHREGENGRHVYSSYGINWFSRAKPSAIEREVITQLQPKNTLLPPSKIMPVLIQKENPLLFSSAAEQTLLEEITTEDRTLVRLTYNYDHVQEVKSYKVTPETMGSYTDPLDTEAIFPDDNEIFADEVEIFFREESPYQIMGQVTSIEDDSSNELLSILRTGTYTYASNGEQLIPEIDPTTPPTHFIGGVFQMGDQRFIIQEVILSSVPEEGPTFKVFKAQVSASLVMENPNMTGTLIAPEIIGDGIFMTVENMLTPSNWGATNPNNIKIKIGDNWPVRRHLITQEGPDDGLETIVEKTRGIWKPAAVEEVLEPIHAPAYDSNGDLITPTHQGLYKITYGGFSLGNHPQFNDANKVQWEGGTVRIPTANDPNGPRRILDVVKIENIGTSNDLIIYAQDQTFESPDNQLIMTSTVDTPIEINYYPGYKIYFYQDANFGLTEDTTLPGYGEGVKYTIWGLRVVEHDQPTTLYSKMSTPATMFAQELRPPQRPQLPEGSLYATRPDTFGRATYTFTTQFTHRPHAVLYYRANEFAILNALYKEETIKAIKAQLDSYGIDEFFANRWNNLLRLEYLYDSADPFNTNGQFGVYPPADDGYRFPNPDKKLLFETVNGAINAYNQRHSTSQPNVIEGSLTPFDVVLPAIADENEVRFVDYIKFGVFNAFVPLTELPMIYDYINPDPYQPVPKKQVIRDRNGALLSYTSPDFDMAPMAKQVAETDNNVLFTDFALDGTSDNVYFYAVKEMGNTMQLGDFSPVLGPIKLVNTKEPEAPEIKRVMPVLENQTLSIQPGIQFEINAYPKVINIKQIKIYRTFEPQNSLSVRTMDMIKEIDLTSSGLLTESIWKFKDEFDDLTYVPYSDPLYYRIVVLREVEYAGKELITNSEGEEVPNIITEYAPSLPSKLLMATIVENGNPEAPDLLYNADVLTNPARLQHVIIKWDKTVHNGKYHLYKMNNQGNWVKIHEVVSNDLSFQLLLADTDLEDPTLSIENEEGNPIYHHFKIDAENSVGMFSTEEKIMTIPNENFLAPDEGVGNMIVENTFIARGDQ